MNYEIEKLRAFAQAIASSMGKTLSPDEARDFLYEELGKGRKVIPCSSECGNPCKHSEQGCTGFDYQDGGCPGYEINHEEVERRT